jgi:hypothetical protein
MDEELKKGLDKEEVSPLHKALLDHCMDLAKMGRDAVTQNYDKWDNAQEVYRSYQSDDKEDEKAREKKQPGKQQVPLTFAQVQTFVSFLFLLFTQNDKIFQYKPGRNEDYPVRKDLETFIERDVNKNEFLGVLYQILLDIGRFNRGIIKTSWVEDYVRIPQEVMTEPKKLFGFTVQPGTMKTEWMKVLQYQGNKIVPVSPYKWFPDPRVPLTRFQDGEFCASEDEYGIAQLRKMEDSGVVAGIKHLKKMSQEYLTKRGTTRLGTMTVTTGENTEMMAYDKGTNQTQGMALITEVQVDIVPKDFKVLGKMWEDMDYPIRWLIWIANDQRIVRAEPMSDYHCKFTYTLGQFTPDMHDSIGQSLADVIEYLQATVTWLINSHIASVRRIISNKVIYDPQGINVKDIESQATAIPTKKSNRDGPGAYVHQMQLQDVTQNFMTDAEGLTQIMQLITGVNENAMGQYASGRRSATESRAVTAGAAGRLKTCGAVIWAKCLAPLAAMLATNLRQGVDEEQFAKVVGRPPVAPQQPQLDPLNPDPMMMQQFQMQQMEYQAAMQAFEQRFAAFKSTPEELVGGNDFFAMDGTMPSEKGFVAQSLQELLSIILSNPDTIQALDINVKALVEEIFLLRGAGDVTRFSLHAAATSIPPRVVASEPTAPPAVPPPDVEPSTGPDVA